MKEIKINNFSEKLFYEKLDSGLEIFMIPKLDRKKYYISFNVKYGNCYHLVKIDNDIITISPGTAHFLEHKLFEKDPSPFDFFSKSGTDVNAATSIRYTSFYCSGSTNFQDNLKYMLNFVTHINLTDENVLKEKGIIKEEIKMTNDNPNRFLYDKIRFNTFKNDPFRYKVIGSKEDISLLTKEKLQLCYDTFYQPSNMFIVIVGNFDYKNSLETIKNNLKHFQNSPKKVSLVDEKEEDEVLKEKEIIPYNVKLPKVSICYKINKSLFDVSFYELNNYMSMYLTLLFGNTSNFFEKVINENIVYDYYYYVDSTKDYFTLSFEATSEKCDQFIEIIDNTLKNETVKEKDFNRIKKVWIADEIKSFDSVGTIASSILTDIIYYNTFHNQTIDEIRKMKYEVLKEIIKKLKLSNKAIVFLVPNDSKILKNG